jgi:ElaB/YqjD/DUF883 family membrane-anchored ribosome-binding protein
MEVSGQNLELTENRNTGGAQKGSTFDQVKSTVAEKLHSTARTIHQKAARGDQQSDLSGFAHRAADWLDRSGNYVSEVEPERVRRDLENQVRQNPGRSLLIAGAVGLVLGGLLRRR